MNRSEVVAGFRTPRGFTLVELLVAVAIIVLLVSILLPSLKKVREQTRTAMCTANPRGNRRVTWDSWFFGPVAGSPFLRSHRGAL